jgi:hypothetical protein
MVSKAIAASRNALDSLCLRSSMCVEKGIVATQLEGTEKEAGRGLLGGCQVRVYGDAVNIPINNGGASARGAR